MRLVKELLSEFGELKTLLKNVFSISTIRIFDYLLPIIVIPYIVRIIGVRNFGKISVAQSYISYFSIFISFGFNYSTTRLIAINRDKKKEIEELFFDTLFLKSFFLCISFLFIYASVYFIKAFREDSLLFFYTSLILIGETLFPIWFFQGMEKLDFVPKITIPNRILFTLLIFIFVRKSSDYFLIPLFYSLGPITSGLIGVFIVIKKYRLTFRLPSLNRLWFLISESFLYFASRMSITFYNSTNVILIKLILGDYYAGIYSASSKLIKVGRKMLQPFYISILPYFSKSDRLVSKKYNKLNSLLFLFSTVIIITVSFVIFIFSESIIKIFFGIKFLEASRILKILSISLPFYHMAAYIGAGILVPYGFKKVFNYSVIIPSLLHLAILLIIFMLRISNVDLIAFTVVFTQILIFSTRLIKVVHTGKLRFIP